VLSGAEDLMPVPTPASANRCTHDVQRYRPRVEGLLCANRTMDEKVGRRRSLARYDARQRSQHLRASPAGRTPILTPLGLTPQRPASGRHARVFSWLLEKTRDDRGNVARYHYKAEDGAGVETRPSEISRFRFDESGVVFSATAQRYLARIQYGNRQLWT
jgi:hypothetical protein